MEGKTYISGKVVWQEKEVLLDGRIKVTRVGDTYAGGNATEVIGPDESGVLRRANKHITWGHPFTEIKEENEQQ